MKKRTKLLSALIGAGLMTMAVAGCGGDGEKASTGSVLKVGVTNFADNLEPTENYFAWVVVRYGIGETLVKFDDKMNFQPWLAESWKISDDKLTWTFKIKDAAKFSNGKKVDAAAVKASLERVFAKTKRAETYFKIASMEAKGQELMITTTKPEPNLVGSLADPLFLVVDVQSEKEGRDFKKQGPIGTGPYICESFTKEKAVMKKNTNYWDGAVPFETVEIPSIDDPNTRAMALQSGEVDMAVNIAAGDIGLFKDASKFHVDKIASLRTVLMRINHKGILGDDKVRSALISCADRKTYNEVILKGTFAIGKAPVAPSLDYGFDQLKDPNTYDVEKAKKLLDEAGWKDTDGDGVRDKDGKPLKLDLVLYNSRAELPIYSEALQADARKVGIDIKLKTVDYNILDKMGINGEYDLMVSNILTANTGDPESFLNGYWRTNIDGNNPQNGSGYSNPEYDALCKELSSEFDKAKRRQLIIDMQQKLLDDGASIFLGYPETNIISTTKIAGAKMYPSDYYWVTKDVKPAK